MRSVALLPLEFSRAMYFLYKLKMKRARASLIHGLLPHSWDIITTGLLRNMAPSLSGAVHNDMAWPRTFEFRSTKRGSEWFSHTLSLWGVSHVQILVGRKKNPSGEMH